MLPWCHAVVCVWCWDALCCYASWLDVPASRQISTGTLLSSRALPSRCLAQQLWRWMQELPDANGRAHGVALGSLEPRAERSSSSMKPTAASLR